MHLLLEPTLLGEASLGPRAAKTGSMAPSGGSRPPAAWSPAPLRTRRWAEARLPKVASSGDARSHAPLRLAAPPGMAATLKVTKYKGLEDFLGFPGQAFGGKAPEEQSGAPQACGDAHPASPDQARSLPPTPPP